MTSSPTGRSRFVLDTNVLVSALLFETSVPAEALRVARGKGDVVLSKELAAELIEVLQRPQFDRFVTREVRDAFVATLIDESVIVEVVSKVEVCRDSDDNAVVALGIDGAAACIVSGDQDLLSLAPFRGLRILTPRAFVEEFAVDV